MTSAAKSENGRTRVKTPDVAPARVRRAPGPARRMVATADQCRCHCGSMLARMVRDGLELKCRKCKSLVLITHDELVEMYRQLHSLDPSLPTP